jgi:hypothetical protein
VNVSVANSDVEMDLLFLKGKMAVLLLGLFR